MTEDVASNDSDQPPQPVESAARDSRTNASREDMAGSGRAGGQSDYEALVEKGAGLVHDGHMDVADLEIPTRVKEAPGEVEFTVEELREDVREFLDEHESIHDPEPEADEPDRPVTDGVDWQALWEEFSFDTRGPHGTFFANPIQLELALEVSDQARGNPDDLITRAIEKGILVKVTAEGAKGETPVRGYALQRGGGA